jgi:hypothetical protein
MAAKHLETSEDQQGGAASFIALVATSPEPQYQVSMPVESDGDARAREHFKVRLQEYAFVRSYSQRSQVCLGVRKRDAHREGG